MIWYVFGVLIPYLAFIIFVVGVIYRVVNWARSAVPLKIPLTAGQAYSLPFLKRTIYDRIDSPFTKLGVAVRMFFEVFLMRSLFRNTRFYHDKMSNVDTRWLWFFAMMFHYSLLIILLRHLRFFTNPVPWFIKELNWVDAAIKFWVPPIYISGILALVSLAFLWGRRIFLAKERCISLPSDHFVLILISAILISGTLLRYVVRVDVTSVKELAMGLVTFHPPGPQVLQSINPLFYFHLTCVCILIAYIPFSKLMHFVGIFFSPTRNMPNNNRYVRHVNPWDPNPEVPILVRQGRAIKLDWNKYYEMYKDQLDEIEEMGYVVKPEEL